MPFPMSLFLDVTENPRGPQDVAVRISPEIPLAQGSTRHELQLEIGPGGASFESLSTMGTGEPAPEPTEPAEATTGGEGEETTPEDVAGDSADAPEEASGQEEDPATTPTP